MQVIEQIHIKFYPHERELALLIRRVGKEQGNRQAWIKRVLEKAAKEELQLEEA